MAENCTRPLTAEELARAKEFFGENGEMVTSFKKKDQRKALEDIALAILAIARRHIVNLEDLESCLGLTRKEFSLHLRKPIDQKLIKYIRHFGQNYLEPA